MPVARLGGGTRWKWHELTCKGFSVAIAELFEVWSHDLLMVYGVLCWMLVICGFTSIVIVYESLMSPAVSCNGDDQFLTWRLVHHLACDCLVIIGTDQMY